jgi:predicted ferric reductase
LSYSRWRWLHATLGFGVLLGFAHVLSLGIDAGAILAMLAGLLLLLWRLIRVDVGLAAKPFVVRSATRLPGDIVEVRLAPLAQALSAQPGQYVLVAFFSGPRYRGCGEYHPFTVSAIGGKETGGEFRIDVKALGDCTRRMQTLEAGVTARVLGPFGEFLAQRCPGPQLWVAGGIGITPFLGALRSQPPRHSTHLLYLFRSDADAAFIGELERAARENAGFTFLAQATGSGLPDLAKLLPAGDLLASRDCYLCGPPGLVKAAATLLQARGVPAHAIHRERFDFR